MIRIYEDVPGAAFDLLYSLVLSASLCLRPPITPLIVSTYVPKARALLRQGLKTYSEILTSLKEPPAKVGELSAKREYVFALEGQISRVQNMLVIPSLQRIELLHQFEGSIPQKDLALSMNIRLWPQKLRKAAEVASEMMTKRQKLFERDLFKEQSSECL